jgi:hypothetical protein
MHQRFQHSLRDKYPHFRGSLRGERGEKEEPLVTSVANPTTTLDLVNLACDWPFVKICQTGLGNKHYCKLIIAIKAIIIHCSW